MKYLILIFACVSASPSFAQHVGGNGQSGDEYFCDWVKKIDVQPDLTVFFNQSPLMSYYTTDPCWAGVLMDSFLLQGEVCIHASFGEIDQVAPL